MVDLGTLLTYRGCPHVVVGVTPLGATPRLFELKDVESGRIRRVEWTDPGLDTSRAGLVIARTQPTSRRATKEESRPASAEVLTVCLTARQFSPVTSNERM